MRRPIGSPALKGSGWSYLLYALDTVYAYNHVWVIMYIKHMDSTETECHKSDNTDIKQVLIATKS